MDKDVCLHGEDEDDLEYALVGDAGGQVERVAVTVVVIGTGREHGLIAEASLRTHLRRLTYSLGVVHVKLYILLICSFR